MDLYIVKDILQHSVLYSGTHRLSFLTGTLILMVTLHSVLKLHIH